MPVDYEVEYDNRARVPEHPEIFTRWQREGAAYRAAAHNRETGTYIWPLDAPHHRSFPGQGRRQGPARDVHSRRLVALARAFDVFPDGGGSECARRYRRGCRLRSVSARVDCRHHRADARSMSDALAQTAAAHFRLRTFGRRASLPPAWQRPTGKLSLPMHRPILCLPHTQSPACLISCRWCRCR